MTEAEAQAKQVWARIENILKAEETARKVTGPTPIPKELVPGASYKSEQIAAAREAYTEKLLSKPGKELTEGERADLWESITEFAKKEQSSR